LYFFPFFQANTDTDKGFRKSSETRENHRHKVRLALPFLSTRRQAAATRRSASSSSPSLREELIREHTYATNSSSTSPPTGGVLHRLRRFRDSFDASEHGSMILVVYSFSRTSPSSPSCSLSDYRLSRSLTSAGPRRRPAPSAIRPNLRPFLAPHGLPHRALLVPKPLELSFIVPVPDHRIRHRTCGQVRRPLHASLSAPEPFASPSNFQGEHHLRPSLPLLVSITVRRPIVVDVAGFSRRRARPLAVQFRQFSRPSEQAKVAAVPGC
jgi:hypothetical protein